MSWRPGLSFASLTFLAAGAVLCVIQLADAAPITVLNPGFQLNAIAADGNLNDEDPGNTQPGFPPNWTFAFEAGAPASPAWGVQRPDPDAHFYRDVAVGGETAPFLAPFEGDQIGFINLNNDPTSVGGASVAVADSDVVGTLAAGRYTLNVAVGGRNTGSWRNILYGVGLKGEVSGDLGAFTQQTMDPGSVAGSGPIVPSTQGPVGVNVNLLNMVDVPYVLDVPVGSPLIGQAFRVRIRQTNTGAGGTGAFSQSSMDNVRLDFQAIPEPGTMALSGLALLGCVAARRKRV
jgi:hypothetical protein